MVAVMCQLGVYTAFVFIDLIPPFTIYRSEEGGPSIAVPSVSIFTDLFLAISLAYLLRRQRSAIKKTDSVIQKLIVYTFGTGLVTAACALVTLVAILRPDVGFSGMVDDTIFILPAKCKIISPPWHF